MNPDVKNAIECNSSAQDLVSEYKRHAISKATFNRCIKSLIKSANSARLNKLKVTAL